MQLVPATRTGVIPLVGVYGKSGSGKTHSALLLAIGICRALYGKDRDVAIVDTENKRSGIVVDLLPTEIRRLDLDEPFSPARYMEAIELLENSKVGCGVIDSMTHEWSGEGGILEWQERELQRMAGDDYRKRESCKMAAWIAPKLAHKAMVKRILRSSIPLVCCLRADEKTHMDKKDGEKTKVVTDEFTTPDFDKKFIFEMLCNLETVTLNGKPGCARITKWSHPDILNLLPKDGEQISIAHGEALGRWCLATVTNAKRTSEPSANVKKLKLELWNLTKEKHHGEARALEQWLWDEAVMELEKNLVDATESELRAYIQVAKKKLKK